MSFVEEQRRETKSAQFWKYLEWISKSFLNEYMSQEKI